MKLKITAIAAALLVGGVLTLAAMRPDHFRVQRTATIQAPPERIFPLINDLRRFNAWNPFEKKDPGAKGSYAGAVSGKGAAYAFEGAEMGRGRIEIIDSLPSSEVRMKLDMRAPIAASNVVEFTLHPDAGGTRVTWAMQGPVPYLAKIIHLFIDVDAMVGREFETGLATLKAMVER